MRSRLQSHEEFEEGVGAIIEQQFLSGSDIRKIIYTIEANIELYKEQINRLNVFPVPDGDTGSNLDQTMKKVGKDLKALDTDLVKDILALVTQSSLMGARGNSGVILSQIIRGICEPLMAESAINAEAIVKALENSVVVAYQSVLKPVEGTMLTVIKGASKAGRKAFKANGSISVPELLEHVAAGAGKTLESTPELLPVLKEAGVVDAGGYGLVIMLESAVAALKDEALQNIDEIATGERKVVDEKVELTFGYCTEFVIKTDGLDEISLEEKLAAIGDSVVIAGAGQMWRVHVHTDNPGQALELGLTMGSIKDVKINNMRDEAAAFQALGEGRKKEIATVAVVQGAGNKEIFASLGVDGFVDGGQSMNPSTQELLEAIEAVPSDSVIVMPNNKNVIMTAGQAAKLSAKNVAVVETTSMPQAFSVLMEFNIEDSLQNNASRMRDKLSGVHVGELTTAVRNSKVNGIKIKTGDYIAIVDDQIVAAQKDLESAVDSLCRSLVKDESELVTVLLGGDISLESKDRIIKALKEGAKHKNVEILEGGQPLYHAIVSVE